MSGWKARGGLVPILLPPHQQIRKSAQHCRKEGCTAVRMVPTEGRVEPPLRPYEVVSSLTASRD